MDDYVQNYLDEQGCAGACLDEVIDGFKEKAELKELTDGIMNESNTQHILGGNAYEKFCQAMCELNYDEKWITELKQEKAVLSKAQSYLFNWLEASDSYGEFRDWVVENPADPPEAVLKALRINVSDS